MWSSFVFRPKADLPYRSAGMTIILKTPAEKFLVRHGLKNLDNVRHRMVAPRFHQIFWYCFGVRYLPSLTNNPL
jgi:hypothetical protein